MGVHGCDLIGSLGVPDGWANSCWMTGTTLFTSVPAGHSINDFIDPLTYSLSYCSIDDAYTIINKLGPGALLSKIDLKDAFRLIPV